MEHEHSHDSGLFGEHFPLPLRILCLITLGIFAWASNLHFLTSIGIDTASVLDIRAADHPPALPLTVAHETSSSSRSVPAPPSSEGTFPHPSRLHVPIYKLACTYAAWTALGWLVYTLVTSLTSNESLAKFTPAAFSISAVLVVFMPWDRMKKRERFMFLRSLKRIVFDGLFSTVPFCDVILADILTSFAKVLGDVWISTGLLIGADTQNLYGGYWGVPLLNSIPYLLRLRQCLAEYITATPTSAPSSALPYQSPTPATPRARSLCNALKYASAFPVIIFSALQGPHFDYFQSPEELAEVGVWFGSRTIARLWIFSVLVNTLYSFWWDVTNDWGLSILLPSCWSIPNSSTLVSISSPTPDSDDHEEDSPLRSRDARLQSRAKSSSISGRSQVFANPSRQPLLGLLHGSESSNDLNFPPTSSRSSSMSSHRPQPHTNVLRSPLLLADPFIYYLLILLDLLLRFTWSLKLSSHLHSIHEIEQGVFLLEALEVIRRWMWCYVRIEWETVRKGGGLVGSRAVSFNASAIPHDVFTDAKEGKQIED